jgi:hypothetical protein
MLNTISDKPSITPSTSSWDEGEFQYQEFTASIKKIINSNFLEKRQINRCYNYIKENRSLLISLAKHNQEGAILRIASQSLRKKKATRKKGQFQVYLTLKKAANLAKMIDGVLKETLLQIAFADIDFAASAIFGLLTPENESFAAHPSSGLSNVALVSKQWRACALRAKRNWIETEEVSLKIYGFKDADEAIAFAIKENLHTVNLVEFPDLNDLHLELLGDRLPNLWRLSIKSQLVTRIPDTLAQLHTLHCSGCSLLTTLPATLKYAEVINCSDCPHLSALPSELNALRLLVISRCQQLLLPSSLPILEELYCCQINNPDFCYPAGMRNLAILDDRYCSPLPQLPKDLPSDCSIVSDKKRAKRSPFANDV